MKIIPMRDLKKIVEIERLCNEEDGSVFVTKNGYCKLVVMNIDYFDKTMRKIYEAKAILKGLEDLDNNKVIEGRKAIDALKSKYDF